jgi:drug/metabolite transporter (DMT)-like permease
MHFLILTIFLTVGLFVIFRAFSRFGINTFQAIVVNYWVCVITGLLFASQPGDLLRVSLHTPWVQMGVLLGLMFIFTFNLMGQTTQQLGVTVATVAGKMSLVVPVLASVFLFGASEGAFSATDYLGMILAFTAILLTSIKKKEKLAPPPFKHPQVKLRLPAKALFMPLGVFVFSGLIDTTINYTNYRLLDPAYAEVFPIVSFGSAALVGGVILAWQLTAGKQKIRLKEVLAGIILGVPNYFSIYFLVLTLTEFSNDGAFLYPIINVGVVVVSALAAVIIFREKLTMLNRLGVLTAILAILLLSWDEISRGFAW